MDMCGHNDCLDPASVVSLVHQVSGATLIGRSVSARMVQDHDPTGDFVTLASQSRGAVSGDGRE